MDNLNMCNYIESCDLSTSSNKEIEKPEQKRIYFEIIKGNQTRLI